MRVAVWGCGPAGLLAAHAVAMAGHEPVIVSQKRKSRTGGAMYLHVAIPGVTVNKPDAQVQYVMEGDARTYARKVYGRADMDRVVSFDTYKNRRMDAWNLIDVYDRLWAAYHTAVFDSGHLGPANLKEHLDAFDAVVVTIPRKGLCRSQHKFLDQPIYILNECVREVPDNTILYNGSAEGGEWYRASNLWGNKSTEWSAARTPKPPLPDIVTVHKPFAHECDCWAAAPNLLFTGRFGSWDKRELSHDAFYKTWEMLDAMQ